MRRRVLVAAARARRASPTRLPRPRRPMPAPQDVKIETISVAPGIYMLVGRGGNIGLTVGVDGAAIIDDQFDDMAPKAARRGGDAVRQAREVPDQHAPARRSHRRQRRLRQGGRRDHRARKRAQAARHRAGQSVDQRSRSPRARAKRCRWSRSRTRRRCTSTTTISSSRTCRMRTPKPTSSSVSARPTCCTWATRFTGGFPFIDGNTGGTLDGLIRGHETGARDASTTTTKIIRGHGPLGNKAELQAYHDMLVVVRDRVAKLVKAGKSQDDVVDRASDEGVRGEVRRHELQRRAVDRPRLRRPEERAREAPEEKQDPGCTADRAARAFRESPSTPDARRSVQHNAPHHGLFAQLRPDTCFRL